jgi:hypothetical protein
MYTQMLHKQLPQYMEHSWIKIQNQTWSERHTEEHEKETK